MELLEAQTFFAMEVRSPQRLAVVQRSDVFRRDLGNVSFLAFSSLRN